MEFFVTQVLNGLVVGAILFLIASGLSLIFGLMNVVNAAHGSFFMLGAFIGFSIEAWSGDFWTAVLIAPVLPILIGLVVERFFLRKLYSRGHLEQVLLTFGFTFIFFDAVKWVWGADIKSLSTPELLAGAVQIGGIIVPKYRLFLIASGLIFAVALWLLIERTRLGAMVRAGVDDAATAEGLGINVMLLSTVAFALGVGMAALGGILAAPVLGVYIGMDFEILIPAFIVVVIGGLGSLSGAFIGSVLIGMATTFGQAYLPQTALFLTYLLMIAVLLLRPSGLFGLGQIGTHAFQGTALSSAKLNAATPSRAGFLIFASACAFLSFVPHVTTSYGTALISEILIFAILAMSLDLLIGYTGLISFGHAAFFSIGAYAIIILNVHFGVNAWIGMIAAVSFSTIGAIAIGSLCIRVTGIPFLMLTLAFSQLVFSVALKWRDLTGGSDGIGGLIKPTLFGLSLENRTVMFYVALAGFFVSALLLYRLTRSPLGAIFIGIRENENRMRAMGYNVQRYKLISFAIAGALAGFAGSLYALFNGFVSSDLADWAMSGDLVIMVILGGAGTIFGPVVGTAIFLIMKNVVSSYTEHWMFVIGATFVTCVMFMPDGLWSFTHRLAPNARAKRA